MYALTRTPLGRMANAVRDNPERAQFVGYDPQRVRFLMVALSGFFAGIAGGLAALNYEIVTAESLSAHTSGLRAARDLHGRHRLLRRPDRRRRGGHAHADRPRGVHQGVAALFRAVFLATVLFVPGGIASWSMLHKRLWDARAARAACAPCTRAWRCRCCSPSPGRSLVVEMTYHAAGEIRAPSPPRIRARHALAGAVDRGARIVAAASLACRWTWRRARRAGPR